MKILSVGEIIWDVYGDKQVIGGAPLNFAAHCAGCGAQSFLLSAVGEDALGDAALKSVADFGVDCELIRSTTAPTGQCIVTLDEKGIPNYTVLEAVAYDNIAVEDSDIKKINAMKFDALYFGTLVQRNAASREAVRRIARECSFREIICDVNLRKSCYDAESIRFCLENATILKISEEEEPMLQSFGFYSPQADSCEDIAKAICREFKGISVVIITLGEKGAFAYSKKENKCFMQNPKKVEVKSTVGAGDSFAAAWITSYLKDKDIPLAMKKAAALSGFVVSHTEAVPKGFEFYE